MDTCQRATVEQTSPSASCLLEREFGARSGLLSGSSEGGVDRRGEVEVAAAGHRIQRAAQEQISPPVYACVLRGSVEEEVGS